MVDREGPFFHLPSTSRKKGKLIPTNQCGNVRQMDCQKCRKRKKIKRWNHIFWRRYSKYRQRWIQNNHYKSSEDLPCLPLQKRFQWTNYSYRHPRITTIDFITEVADETAQGSFLKICVSAHLRANLAVINLLNYLAFPVKKGCLNRNGETHFIWYRERPLKFLKKG